MKDLEKNRIQTDLEMSYRGVVAGISDLGYDIETDNFKDTPFRCAKALTGFILPKKEIEERLPELLEKEFPNPGYDEMVVERNIDVVSMCPHHLLPIEMKVTIGYIPSEKVIGASKLGRLAKLLGRQPILQEDYTRAIAEALKKLRPLGCGVYVIGKHGCMRFRGAYMPQSDMITNQVFGNFKNNPSTKQEFLLFCER